MQNHASDPKIPMTGLTYNDVLLIPDYADFSRSEIQLQTRLTKSINLDIPFISSPMDTVTEESMAVALAKAGGIGIIHRNLSITKQAEQVASVKHQDLLVGAAVGASESSKERIQALIQAEVDVIVVDSAHGHTKQVIDAIKLIKSLHPTQQIIGGSVATEAGARDLIAAGADALRVGMGPGAICTTRIVSGMGVPQITAIRQTAQAVAQQDIPIIADGGIQYSGDIVKALAAGADTVMMGSYFASCLEAPGEVVELTPDQVPSRFKSITNSGKKTYSFKTYRGMGSEGAMKHGAEVKSEDEFHGKSYSDRVLVAEGVEGLVPVNGSVSSILDQSLGGIKSGMFYVGCRSIADLKSKAQFMQITQASLIESHPHDILVTNSGDSYR